MSEVRKDPASSAVVILAPERAGRPFGQKARVERKEKEACPFCEGDHEPGNTYHYRLGSDTYEILVVRNKYPALSYDQGEANGAGAAGDTSTGGEGAMSLLYHASAGIGGHEVLVEGKIHKATLASATREEIESLILTYKERYLYWDKDDRIRYTLIFRNYGLEAGASLNHPHSQLIALPTIPPRIQDEIDTARSYYLQNNECCLYCDMYRAEAKTGKRILFENETFVAYAPYAPRFSYELRIAPKVHHSDFQDISNHQVKDLAETLSYVARSYSSALGDPPFNMIVHTTPTRIPGLAYYHWHIEMFPRLTRPAGFEWGAGIYINSVTPEQTVVDLKSRDEVIK